LASEFFSEVADLLVDELFFEERLFFVVEALFEDLDFGLEGLLVCVFAFEFALLRMFLRILKLTRKILNLLLFLVQLIFHFNYFLSKLWHLRYIFLYYF